MGLGRLVIELIIVLGICISIDIIGRMIAKIYEKREYKNGK